MKILSRIALAAVAALLLTACGGKESTYQYKTQYLPVQLVGSEKWSILDINSGEVVAKDAFDNAPSPVLYHNCIKRLSTVDTGRRGLA